MEGMGSVLGELVSVRMDTKALIVRTSRVDLQLISPNAAVAALLPPAALSRPIALLAALAAVILIGAMKIYLRSHMLKSFF
eukprot:SAG11_NODE_13418_length_656_cov_0.730700_2_plen_81_part_00